MTGIKPGDPDGGLVIRDGAGRNHAAIGVLANGAQVHVIQRSPDNAWAMIPYGNTVGWVSTAYLNSTAMPPPQPQPMPAGNPGMAPDGLPLPAIFHVNGVASGDVLNIRAKPQPGSKILHMVANGIPLAVLGMATNDWAKVQIGKTEGFAHIRYLRRGGGTTNNYGFQLGLNCIGTEPFWNMQFNTNQTVVYSIAGQTAAPVPLQSTSFSANSPTGYPYSFVAQPYSGQVNMEICSDGMSDNTYPMSITINAVSETGAPMIVNGCCRLQ